MERRKQECIGNYTNLILIMIWECENKECMEWMKMYEPIFEDMGIDILKILISISIKNHKHLGEKNATGDSKYLDKLDCAIYIRNDLQFDCFIQTYAHEVGHVTQKFGVFKNPNCINKRIADWIAYEFENKFLIRFNKKYDKNIPLNTYFRICLGTKSEYKLK